jgi:HD-GYP domain-containing protein (c-di-GMP phosphodiesterase class II)
MPYEDALAEMERHTGAQFDPVVVEALLAVVSEHDREVDEQRLPVILTALTSI